VTQASKVSSPVADSSADFDWVPETRFGTWFQGTGIWTRYVLCEALDELKRLAGDSLAENPVILDAGCGAGIAFPLIYERFAPGKIVATEIEPEYVVQARAAATAIGCPIEVMRDDASKSSLPAASFDAIICHQTLHHVSQQKETLAEFRRLLKPGGLLLLSESCQSFTESFLVRMLFRHPYGNQQSAKKFLAMIEAAGFAVGRECSSTPDPWWARPGMGLPQRLSIGKAYAATQLCVAAMPTVQST
jgi:SAM-dependent methyltransferase